MSGQRGSGDSARGGAEQGSGSGGGSGSGSSSGSGGGFGHLVVERSGGIGGFLLVWDIDIDESEHREEIGPRVAELPWSSDGEAQAATAESAPASTGADRYDYVIESRFGFVRFGEAEMPGEWKSLVDDVRAIVKPERRAPGSN